MTTEKPCPWIWAALLLVKGLPIKFSPFQLPSTLPFLWLININGRSHSLWWKIHVMWSVKRNRLGKWRYIWESDVTSICIRFTWARRFHACICVRLAGRRVLAHLPQAGGRDIHVYLLESVKISAPQCIKWLGYVVNISIGELQDLKMFWNCLLKRRKWHFISLWGSF